MPLADATNRSILPALKKILLLVLPPTFVSAEEYVIQEWKKIRLTDEVRAEGADAGELGRSGT